MKVIYNRCIPLGEYWAINLFGLIFVKEQYGRLTERTLNHELIHTAQQKDLLYIFFYILYLIEWVYRLIFHTKTAYRGISFEREAYDNQDDLDYLKKRRHFAMWRKPENQKRPI